MRARQTIVRLLLASAVTASGLMSACGGKDADPRLTEQPTNVILISIDTLRPDHLGCYGYEKDTSPALDLLCDDAVVFEQAIAQAPSTLHSHASMLTSLLPHHHLATWSGKTRLAEEALTVAEVLQEAGYRTAAFSGGGQMDRVFGLDQGFELYNQPSSEKFSGTVRAGLDWLESADERPFFLFLHSYEVHHPYTPRKDYLELFDGGYSGPLPDDISIDLLREINRGEIEFDAARDLPHVLSAYDAEIRSADDGLAILIRFLKDSDQYDSTLIVFTSDHGEEFGEHGVVGWHSHTLYDELLRVPLVVKLPASTHAGQRVAAQVRGIDIPPTVVAAAGLEIPEVFSGVDLGTRIGDEQEAEMVAISRLDRPPTQSGATSVRQPDWKLIDTDLFDLSRDPDEQWYGSATGSGVEAAERLTSALQEALESRQPLVPEVVAPADSTLDELRALGYIQ